MLFIQATTWFGEGGNVGRITVRGYPPLPETPMPVNDGG
jgi:hypothetical protein